MKVCLHLSDSHPTGAMQGGSPLFDLASRDNSARKRLPYLPTVWLASCRIRLNCFFILYFLCQHLRGEIFRITSHNTYLHPPQRCSTNSNLPFPPFPSSQAASAEEVFHDYIFSIDRYMYIFCTSIFAPLPAQGCWTSPPCVHSQAGSDSSDKQRLRSNAVWEMQCIYG